MKNKFLWISLCVCEICNAHKVKCVFEENFKFFNQKQLQIFEANRKIQGSNLIRAVSLLSPQNVLENLTHTVIDNHKATF